MGGDDVCALFDTKAAIKVAHKYPKIFEEKMKKVRYYLYLVTISKAKVPIYLMMKQALNLQKNAKVKK